MLQSGRLDLQARIPCSGNLGLFSLPPETHALLLADSVVAATVAKWKVQARASPSGLLDDNLTRGLRYVI